MNSNRTDRNRKILVTDSGEMFAVSSDLKRLYIYVLESKADGKWYIGYTKRLRSRIEQHNAGKVEPTKHRRPLDLIYYEGCESWDEALQSEEYLKANYGKMFIE